MLTVRWRRTVFTGTGADRVSKSVNPQAPAVLKPLGAAGGDPTLPPGGGGSRLVGAPPPAGAGRAEAARSGGRASDPALEAGCSELDGRPIRRGRVARNPLNPLNPLDPLDPLDPLIALV